MRYLLAVDGKQPADKAAEFLLRLLVPGDVLFVAFVQPEISFLENLQDRETLLNSRQKYVDELASRYQDMFRACKDLDMRFDAYTGDPRQILLDKAEERQVDVLVVGHRGLGAIQRALMGSVSEYLVKNAQCSVLVC